MANLVAIVRATRASARALGRMQCIGRKLNEKYHTMGNRPDLLKAYRRAERAYARAQITLANNPI
jgi:hypothetical protein